jgi:hypothetical protein
MAPFQTSVTLSDENRDGQEVIEVQILPQVSNCLRHNIRQYAVKVRAYTATSQFIYYWKHTIYAVDEL